MNDDARRLIESLRKAAYTNLEETVALLAAALRDEGGCAPEELIALLRAPQIPLRLAAVEACRGRKEPHILEVLAPLANDPESKVREKLAQSLEGRAQGGLDESLARLCQDADEKVRAAAIKASASLPKYFARQVAALKNDFACEVRLAGAEALGTRLLPAAIPEILTAIGSDSEWDVREKCAEILEKHLARSKAIGKELLQLAILDKVESELQVLGERRFQKLMKWVRSRKVAMPDPEELARYGVDLTALAMKGALPRAHGMEKACATLLEMLQRERALSIALLGEAGCGKTALVSELVYHLMKPENGGWRVLRVAPNEFLVGTRYLGEWETKLAGLVKTVSRPRRVIVYIPNLDELSYIGRSEQSDANVATALAPHLEDRSVLILGESTPSEYERGLGAIPSMRRLFDTLRLDPAGLEDTRKILAAVREESGFDLPDVLLDQVLEFADQFLGNLVRPGNAAALLRELIARHAKKAEPVASRHILDALSRSTGIPTDLLDDHVALDLPKTRSFFESRVTGQPEAIDAVVDLVTLIKAGLNDPHKPMGVLLFVGPTGVGKTELARALAEFIFGDPARLKRFDMSEFASQDGFERLIGTNREKGLLTDAVRQYPFSVVLLDEIEKSHRQVFDLCLQLFDAGRLTDGRGRTVDFRRTIVILTSNIGASSPFQAAPGFAGESQGQPANKDRVLRELSTFFRPEFLNRIDRIIHFRPLSLQVAETIARREIHRVLQRTGISRRGLAIDVDPSVVSLLVKEGYSPHFGARPLKRAVERLVLLPVGRIIATGKVPEKAVLRLVMRDQELTVHVTPTQLKEKSIAAPRVAHGLKSLREASQSLLQQCAKLEERVAPLAAKKSELLQRTQIAGFYAGTGHPSRVFDEIHRLDQFLAAQRDVQNAVTDLHQRLQGKPSDRELPEVRDRFEQLSIELRQLRSIAGSHSREDLGDALVCLTLVDRLRNGQRGVERLTEMYLALAKRRKMSADVLAELQDDKQDCVYIEIAGLGAFGLLKGESGLHQLMNRFTERATRSGKEKKREDRDVVRVDVFPAPIDTEAPLKDQELTLKVEKRAETVSRFVKKADLEISLFHEPSLASVRAWARGPKADAVSRVRRILQAQTNGPRPASSEPVVRRYDLGPAPKVKDLRTGQSTTRVDKVLKGHLDMFLMQGEPTA